jgi:epoxyqueuosine reductase
VKNQQPEASSLKIKSLTQKLGFDYCGISRATFLEKEAKELETWLKQGFHGQMNWMENHFDKRTDPRLLMPGAKSVISFLFNYYPEKKQTENSPKISKYAYGKDYHFFIKDKLAELIHELQNQLGQFEARIFVDSAPVMDKVWAARGGLGWQGKNTNLIHPKMGSFFFIGEIICDLDLLPDGPIKDYCGTCTRCIDECPTDAFIAPQKIDASKCISYLTIELKDALPQWATNKMDQWMFGCDVCQDVCPWNRFSKPHHEPYFAPNEKMLSMSNKEWNEITEEVFSEIFKKSAVKRTKYAGLKRNIDFLSSSSPFDKPL